MGYYGRDQGPGRQGYEDNKWGPGSQDQWGPGNLERMYGLPDRKKAASKRKAAQITVIALAAAFVIAAIALIGSGVIGLPAIFGGADLGGGASAGSAGASVGGHEETWYDPAGDPEIDLYAFTLELNGVEFTLPAPYSEFVEYGWEIGKPMGEERETLSPGESYFFSLYNDDNRVYAYFVNNGVDVMPVKDCNVGGIMFDEHDAASGAKVVFPGGITFGSPENDVLVCYGRPSYESSNSSGKQLNYAIRLADKDVQIDIDEKTGLVSRMRMSNLKLSEAERAEEYTGSAPGVVTGYVPPGALGDSLESCTVEYGGAVYRLPAPMAAFVENGWVLESDENLLVSAGDSSFGFYLRNGNQVVYTNIHNYAQTQQPAKYCFITFVEYNSEERSVPIELPGGLTEKSGVKAFNKAYGKPTKTYGTGSSREYEWRIRFEDEEDWHGNYTLSLSVRPVGWGDEIKSIWLSCEPVILDSNAVPVRE
ncbi:MAG: hypothetical protein FWG03_06330 [Clostridiales bacterium]|nr:hypothetical protein [Clostridiales bacterium]